MNQLAALISGKPVKTKAKLAVLDPSTVKVLSEVADCGRGDFGQIKTGVIGL